MKTFNQFLESPLLSHGYANEITLGKDYSKADILYIVDKNKVEQVFSKWSQCSTNFSLIFIKIKNWRKWNEKGEIDFKQLYEILNKDEVFFLKVEKLLRMNAINIIYCNNAGSNKIPFTPWIKAHRIGHAIKRTEVYKGFVREIDLLILNILNYYGETKLDKSIFNPNSRFKTNLFLQVINTLGNFKSIGKLNTYFEFYYEVLAQYINTGKVTFNKQFPDMFYKLRWNWGRKQTIPLNNYKIDAISLDEIKQYVEYYENNITKYLNLNLPQLYGSIFIM